MRPTSTRAVVAALVLTLFAALGVATAPGAAATTTVGVGFRLASGQTLTSTANGYRLLMQTDGNLVLYSDHGVALWWSGTAGRGASSLTLQSDGNLVLYTSAGKPTWSTGTHDGTTFSVQDDGNVVLYSATGRATWCTCALPFTRVVGNPTSLTAGQGMLAGDALVAGDRYLTLQGDGNLVLYGPSGAIWTTHTLAGNRSKLMLQSDGNLVLYGPDKKAVWNSRTPNTAARVLRVGSDGSLQLLSTAGAVVWSVGTGATPTGIAGDVFALLNRQRAANGLPALTSDPKLIAAAAGHNAAMSAANTLAHQLPGEPDPGVRMTAAGYSWRAWAENIAWTTNTTSAGAQALQTAMYNEKPPNDGHRVNILSRSVTQVGVAVLVDARGKLWLTTDFAAPR